MSLMDAILANELVGGTDGPVPTGGVIKIDLLEYGIDVFEMFATGETQATFDKADELFALVNGNPECNFIFVIRGTDGSYAETGVSKAGNGADKVFVLSSYAPMFNGTAYAVGLFVLDEGMVLLRAKEM